MEKVKSLLNEVADLSQKNDKKLDATGARFNVFRLCGVNHYENQHSTILAEFLNPKGTHGLKEKLLANFVKMLHEIVSESDNKLNKFFKDFSAKNARVYTELSFDNVEEEGRKGRLDIIIESNKQAVVIENKIRAGDQIEQLIKYNAFAIEKYGKENYQIIYLTLDGKDASSQSGEGVDYLKVSYEQHIIAWLEECVKIAEDRPMVRETINQYINHIKLLTNQNLDMEFEKNVLEIMLEENNVDAVFHIAHTFNAFKESIIEKFFKELAKEKELDVIEAKSLSAIDGGVFINSKENSLERSIRFEFTSTGFKKLAYGFKRNEPSEEAIGFEKFLVEKSSEPNDWWFWKKTTRISFNEIDIKEIAQGNIKNLSQNQYEECKAYIDKLIKLKDAYKESLKR